jgi:hypothetical protein
MFHKTASNEKMFIIIGIGLKALLVYGFSTMDFSGVVMGGWGK